MVIHAQEKFEVVSAKNAVVLPAQNYQSLQLCDCLKEEFLHSRFGTRFSETFCTVFHEFNHTRSIFSEEADAYHSRLAL